MYTLADQIAGKRGGGPGMPAMGAPPTPSATQTVSNCTFTDLGGLTTATVMCPAPTQIFKKALFHDPIMWEVNGKAHLITSVWGTGTALFYGTSEGKSIVFTKSGKLKVTTPKRMLVINPRNPRLRSLERTERILKRAVAFRVKRK